MRHLVLTALTSLMFMVLFAIIAPVNVSAQASGLSWTNVTEGTFLIKGERRIVPNKYHVIKYDLPLLKAQLNSAPFEFTDASRTSPYIIQIPTPDGNAARFTITEYSMMEPGLAAQFPQMKTYTLKGIDDPYATGKADITELGFHAMVLSPNGIYFVDPYSSEEREICISYYKRDLINSQSFSCEFNEEPAAEIIGGNPSVMTGEFLRTYRLACAATGEYTAFFGGTVALGQAAIVTAINRVNGVYEKDFSVRLNLVANNTSVVYTNGATDPFTNNNGFTMLTQNQNNMTTVIGTANYDIGHVFSTGGGGVAGLGVVCNSTQKARGVTGLPSPTGDPFYIDYVAHEMGHQFGANHTFNSIANACNGNRNAATAWEPGSGSTIMGYAGICSPDDLQFNSDDFFHTGSVGEIINFTQSGGGNSCPVTTATGNTPPVVTVPASGFTIPVNTPFELIGSATDAQGQGSLTYCWEQLNTGPAGSPGSPSGNAPIFRSWDPETSSTRTFPRLSNLINNTSVIGELLPSYTRLLTFRLTVRDNNPGGGGIAWGTVTCSTSVAAGPFVVTSPNTAVNWNSGAQTVTWNVANTTAAPVNCSQVDILLSTDGGNTFPTVLASATSNDGSESVIIPPGNTTTARIKVKATGNVFFDMSNTNFTITGPSAVPSTFYVIPQGFYNTLTGKLNMRDTVTFTLRSTVAPYSIIDQGKTVIDSVTYSGSVTFAAATSGTYYVVEKRRSDFETWSKAGGEIYTQGSPFSYDFKSAQTQAYGNNLTAVGPYFGTYTGDIDNSYSIDLLDIIEIYNAVVAFTTGYVATDVTGDNFVNLNDLLIVYNNSADFVGRMAPPGATPSQVTVLKP